MGDGWRMVAAEASDLTGLSVENSVLRRQLAALAAASDQQRREALRMREQRDRAAAEARAAEARLSELGERCAAAEGAAGRCSDLEAEVSALRAAAARHSGALAEAEGALEPLRNDLLRAHEQAARYAEEVRCAEGALQAATARARSVAQALLPSYQSVARRAGSDSPPAAEGRGRGRCAALATGLEAALLLCEEVIRAKDDALTLLRQRTVEGALGSEARTRQERHRADLLRRSMELSEGELRQKLEQLEAALAEERQGRGADREEHQRAAAELAARARDAEERCEQLRGELAALEQQLQRAAQEAVALRARLADEAAERADARRAAANEHRARELAERRLAVFKQAVLRDAASAADGAADEPAPAPAPFSPPHRAAAPRPAAADPLQRSVDHSEDEVSRLLRHAADTSVLSGGGGGVAAAARSAALTEALLLRRLLRGDPDASVDESLLSSATRAQGT